MSDSIDDKKLIKWFKENYKYIDFINFKPVYERVKRSSQLDILIGKLRYDRELVEQKQILIDIWKYSVANAIIFLKSKDDREFFHDDGDYGIEDLGKFFDSYCDFEKLLYGSGEFYRDHVLHVFRVFLLGEYIAREYLFNEYIDREGIARGKVKDPCEKLKGFNLIDVMDSKLKNDGAEVEGDKAKYLIKPEEKEAMWCIASLTHDLGYPTEVVHEIHDKLKDMLKIFNIQDVSYILSQQSQAFNDNIIKIISSDLELCKKSLSEDKYTTHSQAKYYLKYSRSIENWDHGVESCIVLMKSLVYFLETDFCLDKRRLMKITDARQFLIRQRILRAIASHNCDFIYHLKLDLSFLLRIVDEMQEWNRPKLTDLFIKSPRSEFAIDMFKTNRIEYTIEFYDTATTGDNEDDLHRSVKEYFHRKINKFTKILRSAVDGDMRDGDKFVLTFNVIDSVNIHGNKFKYTFAHNNPETISIQFQRTNPILDPIDINLEKLEDKNWPDFKNNFS